MARKTVRMVKMKLTAVCIYIPGTFGISTEQTRAISDTVIWLLEDMYSSIQMKCQGGNKYALSMTVKFDQSTRKFGRISFARLFKFTKHIVLLFYLLSPYLLSCMRGSRNVRTNMHIIKTIMKFCTHRSTICGMANSEVGGIRTQEARSTLRFRGP